MLIHFRMKKPHGLVGLAILLSTFCECIIAFPAYKCDDPNAEFSEISLTQVEDCHNPPSYRNITKPVILYERSMQKSFKAKRCKVTISLWYCRCGFTSITYSCRYPVYRQMVDIELDECTKMNDEGIYDFYFDGRLKKKIPVRSGTITYANLFVKGKVEEDTHTCTVEAFELDNDPTKVCM